MYNLYINDQYMTNVSTFNEFIDRGTNPEGEEEIHMGLVMYINAEEISDSFRLNIFKPYIDEDTINSIEVRNEEGKNVFQAEDYKKVLSTHWMYEPDETKPRVVINFSE